jgi:hypothetical protein
MVWLFPWLATCVVTTAVVIWLWRRYVEARRRTDAIFKAMAERRQVADDG